MFQRRDEKQKVAKSLVQCLLGVSMNSFEGNTTKLTFRYDFGWLKQRFDGKKSERDSHIQRKQSEVIYLTKVLGIEPAIHTLHKNKPIP